VQVEKSFQFTVKFNKKYLGDYLLLVVSSPLGGRELG
jgi:hypothetical protein